MSDAMGFPELPALAELGERLELAFITAERTRPRPSRRLVGLRPVVVAVLLFIFLAAGTAAAALLALRGSVIPAPAKEDLQPPMIVKPDTARLSGVTARDPSNSTTWTVRLAQSETGLECVTAGELRDGKFGVTGLDGRFRELAPGFADGCGAPGKGRAAVVGARVFDSGKRAQVRTVVDGFGGDGLRSARIESVSGTRDAKVSKEGAFVAVLTGYPEDIGVRVVLRFADGTNEVHHFGTSRFIVPDVGGALRIETGQFSGRQHTLCVNLVSARQVKPFSRSPMACGDDRSEYFFVARRLRKGTHHGNGVFGWEWNHASRTVLYGHAQKVERLAVVGAGPVRRLKPSVNGSFQAVFPASVDPARLTVVVTRRDGTVERRSGSFRLVPYPRSHR